MKGRLSIAFLCCLVGGCVGLYDDISTLVDESRCNLRVGILADTHFNPPHAEPALQKALKYFSDRHVDALVIAGDMTHTGSLAQRRGLKKVLDKAFPPNGPVARILVTGEGDTENVYEDLTGEKFTPAFMREVKGYTFIGANWKDISGVDAWALKPLLSKVGKDKPFFYVQNIVPYATCCAEVGRRGVIDGGKVSYMLSKFPNAVALCGRSHTALTDESAFWRGDFTCVNAGSFSHAQMRGEKPETHKDVHHGLIMSVYDSAIVFERIDFSRAKKTRLETIYEKLGEDWKVTLPATPQARSEGAVPQFWDDTRLMIFPSEKTVSVRFPPILAKHTGVRAYAYEVKAAEQCKTVHSPHCCSPENYETKPVSCEFPRSELPKGNVRFEVTPLDAFGHRGRTIAGETTL